MKSHKIVVYKIDIPRCNLQSYNFTIEKFTGVYKQ